MPAPANDNIANAQILTGVQTTGDNSSSTADAGDYYSSASSVWFRWIAPSTASATITTLGSSFDTQLYVFQANTGVAEPVTAFSDLFYLTNNDDAPGGGTLTSSVTFTPVAGRTYYISLSGSSSANYGPYVLNYPLPAPVVTGTPQGTSFTTSGTSVMYTGGGAVGYVCYDVLCVNSDNTVTTPSGWTALTSAVTNQGSYIFAKQENGVTSATIALGGGVNANTDAIWLRVANTTGADTGASGSAQANSTAGSTTPSFTSNGLLVSGELAIAFAALHAFTGSNPTSTSWSTGYTEQANATIGGGAGAGTATYGSVAVKVPAGTAAESPVFSWTNTVTDRYMLFTAFKPFTVTSAPAGQAAVTATAYDASVDIGASGAVLALHSSSPGTATANALTVQTASFTPPAGSVLYAIALHGVTTATANRTVTITDTVGLTWTLQATSPMGPTPTPAGAVARIYTAPVVTSAAMRVTSTITSNGRNGVLLKVFVYTGADQANPVDQAVTGHSTGVVSQAITTTTPGTIPYLGNIDASGSAAPTTAAGTGTFTTAKPGLDQMWVARTSPAAVTTPGTVTIASTAPTTGTVNDWVMFGARPSPVVQASTAATAYDATVSTANAVSAPAEQTAVAATGYEAAVATGAAAQDTAVTTTAPDSQVAAGSSAQDCAVATAGYDAVAANGTFPQDTAVTVSAFDAQIASGNSTPDTAVAVGGYDATTATGTTGQDTAVAVSAFDAAVAGGGLADQTAVAVAGFDATVSTSTATSSTLAVIPAQTGPGGSPSSIAAGVILATIPAGTPGAGTRVAFAIGTAVVAATVGTQPAGTASTLALGQALGVMPGGVLPAGSPASFGSAQSLTLGAASALARGAQVTFTSGAALTVVAAVSLPTGSPVVFAGSTTTRYRPGVLTAGTRRSTLTAGTVRSTIYAGS